MNDLQNSYKKTVSAIGATLLIWLLIFYFLNIAAGFADALLSIFPNKIVRDIVGSLIYDAIYLTSFMLPAIFFRKLLNHKKAEPMRLDMKVPPYTVAFIFAGVTCSFTFSLINSVIAQAISNPHVTDNPLFAMPEYMHDYNIILQFITIALVPAFCEEFLFRGVILSNLMPYGKGSAIIISSLLFAAMHGNAYQFIYTFVAGLIMGYLYVKTDSIWPSTLMHMINNSISLAQTVILERFEYNSALIWVSILEMSVFFIGTVCIGILACKFGRKKIRQNKQVQNCYNENCENESDFSAKEALQAKDAFSLLLRPTILTFLIFNLVTGMIPIISTWM